MNNSSGENAASEITEENKRLDYQQQNQASKSISEMFEEATYNLKDKSLYPEEIRKYILNQYNVDIREQPVDINLVSRFSRKNYVKVYQTFQTKVRSIKGNKMPTKRKILKQNSVKSKKRTRKTPSRYYLCRPNTRNGIIKNTSNLMHLETQLSSNKMNTLQADNNLVNNCSTRNESLNSDSAQDGSIYRDLNTCAERIDSDPEKNAIHPTTEGRCLIKENSLPAKSGSKMNLGKNGSRLSTKRKRVSQGAVVKQKMAKRSTGCDCYFDRNFRKAGNFIKRFCEDLKTKCAANFTDLYRNRTSNNFFEKYPFDAITKQFFPDVHFEEKTNRNVTQSEATEIECIQETPKNTASSTKKEVPPENCGTSTEKEVPPEKCDASTKKEVPPENCGTSTEKEVPPENCGTSTEKEVPSENCVTSTEKEFPPGPCNISAESSLSDESKMNKRNASQCKTADTSKRSKTINSNKNLNSKIVKRKQNAKDAKPSQKARSKLNPKMHKPNPKQKPPGMKNSRKSIKSIKCTIKHTQVGQDTSIGLKNIRNVEGIKSRKSKSVRQLNMKLDVNNIPIITSDCNTVVGAIRSTQKKRAVKEIRRITPKNIKTPKKAVSKLKLRQEGKKLKVKKSPIANTKIGGMKKLVKPKNAVKEIRGSLNRNK